MNLHDDKLAFNEIITATSTLSNPELIIETYITLLPYPSEIKYVDNYIYRYLKQINRLDLAQQRV